MPRVLRGRRALPWAALVLLLLVAQSLLVVLTLRDESNRRQEEADDAARQMAGEVRRGLLDLEQALQRLAWTEGGEPVLDEAAVDALLRSQRGLARVERRDGRRRLVAAQEGPGSLSLFADWPREALGPDADIACAIAVRDLTPTFSRSYFVPHGAGMGQEVVDLCLAVRDRGREAGFVVASIALRDLLESVAARPSAQRFELSFTEPDGTRLARAGVPRGGGVYAGVHVVNLPGIPLTLRAESTRGRPRVLPGVTTALVLGLSATLLALVAVLARDVRRRSRAETALAESLALQKAMGDSLSTGLRARDLQGRILYVNPAFCAMVGFTPDELDREVPPYWPPEHRDEYLRRQHRRLDETQVQSPEAQQGFETLFMRKGGERFPVMIYQAPLVDGQGRHTGWMSTVVDLTSQRRAEELARQQQDRLQATARLATVGEMASLLSHELNQPLSAIASYASGSLNLLQDDRAAVAQDLRTPLEQALARIAEQAERAGRVIRSVHGFVRRRERDIETLNVSWLVEAVLPLVRLQARKSDTRVEVDLPPKPPSVLGDRTMLEQVLLNLTRNAIQSMEHDVPVADRVLTLQVQSLADGGVRFSVCDAGPGIPPDVAARLFTPFFTTKPEGMGIGLSLCRTVVEQHGGTLEFITPRADGRGTEFRFTLRSAGIDAGPRKLHDA